MQTRQLKISGIDTELHEGGEGRPLLLLHPGDGFDPSVPFVQALTSRYRVIAPSHPGFGRSELPKTMKSVDDLSYFYLDLLDELKLDDVVILGLSFGGWIAAEIAVKNTSHIAGLCLVDTLGAKFGSDPTQREVTDLFAVAQYDQPKLIYHDEARRQQTFANLPDDVAERMARNHESFCLYGWAPTLHNPKLARRLHRIDAPTQLIWGAQDGVVSVEHGRNWQKAIVGSGLEVIDNAGHYPQIEQPERFVATVQRFIDGLPAHGKGRKAA